MYLCIYASVHRCIGASAWRQSAQSAWRLPSVEVLHLLPVPRITLALGDREHLALKLLSLRKNKKVLSLLKEAIDQYLEREGAYQLKIQSTEVDG